MWLFFLVAAYSLLLVLASLVGGWMPSVVRMTHTRMQLTMSFVGGLMLGVAILHLLPHAAVAAGSLNVPVMAMLAGLIAMFLMIRLFHFHAHGSAETAEGEHLTDHDHGHDGHSHAGCDHDQHHEHGPGTPLAPTADSILPLEVVHRETEATVFDAAACHRHPLSWIGLAIGLSLHTLIDGMALAASVAVEANHATTASLLGIGTFLAVFLHKPLDSLSITSVMAVGGASKGRQHLVNFGFALICPASFIAFLYAVQGVTDSHAPWLGYALGFAAGAFICIALSDLLPEVQFHSHDRGKLSIALLLGVLLAYGIGFLESEHQHDFQPGGHDHSHHDHEH